MSRLQQIILFSFGQEGNINIRSPQLNFNFGQRRLSNGFLTVALDRGWTGFMEDQIPVFLLILHNEKCQQVDGQGSGVQPHARHAGCS